MKHLSRILFFAIVACQLMWPALSAAQGTSGVAGVVKDATGAVLPGVTVEANSPVLIEGARVTITDAEGVYQIQNLVPGTYAVTYSLPGFATVRREGIELASNFTASLDIELRVGALEETVLVSGQSPVVDVQRVVRQRTLSRETLDSLPTTQEFSGFAAITVGASMAPTTQDVGGNKDPISAYMSVHGSRPGDSRQLIDGMNFNGEGSGRGWYFNAASAQEIAIETGGASAEKELAGVQANLIPKEGGNQYSWTMFSTFANGNMSSNNLTDELRDRGLDSVNEPDWLYESTMTFGGPIKRNKLWFFDHNRFWGFKNTIAGNYFNATPGTTTYTPDLSRPAYYDHTNVSHGLRLTWQMAERHKLNVGFDIQKTCLCHIGINALVSPEASNERYYGYPNTFWQFKYNFPISNRLLLEAGSSTLFFNWPNYRQPESFGAVRITEQSTGYSWNAQSISSLGKRVANQSNQRVTLSYVTSRHAFKTGFTMELGFHDWIWDDYGNGGNDPFPALPLQYVFLNGAPRSLTLYATPVRLRERLAPNLGVFAQDQWTINNVTLNFGVRFDYFSAYVPEQNLPAGPFVVARDFEKVDCVPCWKDIEPRLGFSWDVFGNGRTAVKASIGRYVDADRYSIVRANNPVQTSVNSSSRVWTDANGDFVPDCDLASPATNGECGQIANVNFGRANPLATSWAPDVLDGWGVRPFSWQSAVEFQHQLREALAFSVGYFRTTFGNWRATENAALTPEDFDAFTFVAPLDPRLPGGGGYSLPGFYDVKPEKFGQSRTVITQSSNYGNESEVYNGFDFTVNMRHAHGTVNGGLNIGRQEHNDCSTLLGRPQMTPATFPLEPSRAGIPFAEGFCDGTRPWFEQVKLQTTFKLPADFNLAVTYQNLPGIPILATMTATSAQIAPYLGRFLASGPRGTMQLQLIEPYTQFEDRISQLDVRLGHPFTLGRVKAAALLDVFNALNASPILSINTNFGPNWRRPTEVLAGRLFKVGVQMSF